MTAKFSLSAVVALDVAGVPPPTCPVCGTPVGSNEDPAVLHLRGKLHLWLAHENCVRLRFNFEEL